MVLLRWHKFFKNLSFENKGLWAKNQNPAMKSLMFKTSDIVVIGNKEKPFIEQTEVTMLVNLVRLAESIGGIKTGMHQKFGIEEIQRAVEASDATAPLNSLIPAIRSDMRHSNFVSPTKLELARRFNTPLRPPLHKEIDLKSDSKWILFLNDDYKGGRVWFPTRGLALDPVAGCAVRFPTGIPYGRTLVRDGYQFTLEGENTHDRSDAESWKGISELAEKGLIQ